MTDDKFKPLRTYEDATPGPWHRCSARDNKCDCGLVWSIPQDFTVAYTGNHEAEDGVVRPPETIKDNATHIATWDPQTCREVVELLEQAENTYRRFWVDLPDAQRWNARLDALLQRLRGEP